MISGEGEQFGLARFSGTDDEVNAQWLAARMQGVGGSDVAAIMGLSPWRSPYQVWADKVLGITQDISDKPAVMWGNILEPVVGEHYKSLHPDHRVRRVNGIAHSIERPWAQASIDYEVNVPGRGWGVLEIKTAGLRSAPHWEDGVPIFYQTQVAHYLSVTGRQFAVVAVLIGGQDYREYVIEHDEDDIAAVDAAVDDFWHRNVEGGVEPTPVAGDGAAVFMAHRRPEEGLREMPDTPALVSRWLFAKGRLDAAKRDVDELASQLKAQIGDAKGWQTPEGRLQWVRTTRSRLDSKRLREEEPEVYEEYTVSAPADGGLRWYEGK